MKEHIDEMTKVLVDYTKKNHIMASHAILEDYAEQLYNAGYRKQSDNVIELPCKVGDTMYVKYKGIAYPVKVNAIRIDTKKNNHRICVLGTFHLYEYYDHDYKATFPFESIGKSLFYTEAEAMKGGAE